MVRLIRIAVLPLTCFALVFCVDAALGCPTCKDQLANDPTAQNLARGYFYSILFMLSMPALIFIGLSSYFYFLVRQARRKADVDTRRPAIVPTGARVAGA